MTRLIATGWSRLVTVRFLSLLGLDAGLAGLALCAAIWVRLDGAVSADYVHALWVALPLLVSVRALAILLASLHRWSFKMSGLPEAARLALATLAGSAVFVGLFVGVLDQRLPRSVYALEFFFSLTLLASYRFAPRLWLAWYSDRQRKETGARTIIVGAGGAADLLARDIIRSRDSTYYIVGYVDDNPTKLNSSLNGKLVLGKIKQLPELIREHSVSKVLLAIPRLPAARIREILDMCASSKTSFKIIPASFSYLDEKISAAMLNDLAPEDLLPRDAVKFDQGEIRSLVEGRRTLVTGAGGSIGGEICRQLAMHGVAELVMVDMNENELYLGQRRLEREYPAVRVRAEVADIREPSRLGRLGDQYRPQYVFHAAAHKHVPLMESAPEEAVKNNVFGTLNVATMAHEAGAEKLVVISTDKAVRPTSVMGVTKRIAEQVVRDFSRRSKTKMTAVRFGNVLGSAGSVVPLFKEQIERGGPVTVTHPECTRYFMTIPEAVGLALLAGLGDFGELCVLDMGEPIRIVDMARNLITMAGLVPGDDVAIEYTGLRPGEKLFEELLTEEEEKAHKVRDRIMVAKSQPPPFDLQERLRELRWFANTGDRAALFRTIRLAVPSFCGVAPAQSLDLDIQPEGTPPGLAMPGVRVLPVRDPVEIPERPTPIHTQPTRVVST